MVTEFIIWLALTVVGSRILQEAYSLAQTISLLIAAPVSALLVSAVMFVLNTHFRKHAQKVTAHVDKILPPQRTGGLARAEVSIPLGGKTIHATLTPEEKPDAGTELPVWVCGRRVLLTPPTIASDFRIWGVCIVIAALAALGYLCAQLLPDPT